MRSAANRSIFNKSDEEAWELIRTIALDNQHGSEGDELPVKVVGTVEHDPFLETIAANLDKLTARVDQISSFQQYPQQVPEVSFLACILVTFRGILYTFGS